MGAVLVGINCLVFRMEHIIEDSFFGQRPVFGLAGDGLFQLPYSLFHFTLLYNIYFSSPITIVSKWNMFVRLK